VHFTAFCLGGPFFPGHGIYQSVADGVTDKQRDIFHTVDSAQHRVGKWGLLPGMQCISNAKASIAERSDSGQILVKFSKPRQLLKGPVNVPCYYTIFISAVGEHRGQSLLVTLRHWYTVVSRMVTFPDGFFPGKTFPWWSFSRMRRFPERLHEW